MSTLLTAVPGDIPGLLRCGSPLFYTEALIPGVVLALVAEELGEFSDPPILSVALFGQHVVEDRCIDIYVRERHHLQLDLTDPTGRAHAAWWLTGRLDQHPGDDVWQAICRATTGIDMTPKQIDTLARLVLRLAGRTP